MSNIKISNLPTYSGTAADLRWFVMNNSGNTETFKFSGYTSALRPVSGRTNSFMTINYTDSNITCIKSLLIGGENNTITSTDATGKNNIIGGSDSTISNGFGNMIINGFSSTIQANQSTIIGGQGQITDGFFNGLFGGVGVVGGNYSVILGGYSNIIGPTFNDRCGILGGQNNVLGNAPNTVVLGGFNNNITASIISLYGGTQDNTVTSAGYTYVLIGGGYNTVNATNASAGNAMYSSYFCTDNTVNDGSTIGSSNNWFAGSRNGNQSGYGKHNWIANSYGSTISNNAGADVGEWFNAIISSSGSTITVSKKSQIIGGESNTISGLTRAVMVGTSGRTALYDNTTHVENSHNFKTESFGVTNVGSVGGSINVDCSLGTLFYFSITANTTPNFINWKEGQRLQFYVENTGSFTVPTATITGGGSVYAKGGTLNPTNNEITAYYGTIVNGNLFLDEHLNFQPV